MLVSASIFSSKNRDINNLIREIQEATTDMIHFDFPMNTAPANPNPKCLYIDMNQQEVLDMVSSTPYHFSIIPILDRNNKIIGTTSSDRVIRGK